MQPLPPNKSALATNFKVGDPVRWMVSQTQISPYIGKVSEVCPGINKLWVEFPIGGNQQMSPDELIIVPPEQGISPVQFSTGYSSYDKEISHRDYGTLSDPKVVKLAQTLVSKTSSNKDEGYSIAKMASKVANTFATDVVEKLASDVLDCLNRGMNEMSTYQEVYQKYSSKCSDGFLRHAVQVISSGKGNEEE